MYESFFQLNARPFLAAPIAERYFPASATEYARETIARCVGRGEGLAVVIGPAGTGKSMLCHVLASQLKDRFPVVMLASARLCTRRALLQNILFELNLPYRDREEGELRLTLIDYLQPAGEAGEGMLLVVDEAHMLPIRLLEEIRMITNLVRDGRPRVRLVMAASLAFDERLAGPRLESLNQRIAARCYLQPMNCEETRSYVRAQIAAVGGDPDHLMNDQALQSVYRATGGVPRLVNQVCDHALVLASLGNRPTLDGAGIEEAWADLQQLPAPWGGEPMVKPAESSSILEFGELDDEPCGDPENGLANGGGIEQAAGALSVEQPIPRNDDAEAPLALPNGGDAPAEEVVAADVDSNPIPLPPPEDTNSSPDEDDLLQFRPDPESHTEIELTFHEAHDPFRESFEEEEVVVDPYASLEVLNTPHSSIADVDSTCKTLSMAADIAEATSEQQAVEAADLERGVDRLSAPVEPGPEMSEPIICLPDCGQGSSRLGQDDRDLLDIVDDVRQISADTTGMTRQTASRRPYRHLFATLRGKSAS